MPKTITLANVRAQLQSLGVAIRRTSDGEYRVIVRGQGEAQAYYTGDLEDARDTGMTMAKGPASSLGRPLMTKEERAIRAKRCAAFTVGQRVEAHPCTDAFAMGDRYGNVTTVGRLFVFVAMDRSARVIVFHPVNLLPVEIV